MITIPPAAVPPRDHIDTTARKGSFNTKKPGTGLARMPRERVQRWPGRQRKDGVELDGGPSLMSALSSNITFIVVLLLLLCQREVQAFLNHPCHAMEGYVCYDSCPLRLSSRPFGFERIRYRHPTSTCPWINRRAPCNSHVALSDKRREKEPEKSKPTSRQTKSVVQSYFAGKAQPPQDPPPAEYKTGFFRSIFRRNKKDEKKEPPSKLKEKKESRKSNPKRGDKEPVLSDKLRQKAKTDEKKKQEEKKERPPKQQKQENSKDDPSLFDRVTSWIPGRGNDTKTEIIVKEDQNNSTNPISAVQQFWQDTVARRSEEWVDVLPTTRISPGDVVPVTVGGLDLLIIAVKSTGNKIYAIANSCPHLGTPLEIGQLVRLPKDDSAVPPPSTTGKEKDKKEEPKKGWTEFQVSSLLQQDGCEDCIVCPLHRTAFALESGQVRGEWCPYPPVVGKMTGLLKDPTPVATFDVRVRKKTIQVRLNSPLLFESNDPEKK